MTKILWKEISQILWIYFMPMYGWLDKAIKLLMKNHEIRRIFPEVNAAINIMNLFHAFVWLNKAMSFWPQENHETCPNWFCFIPEVNAATFNLYFHDRDHDLDFRHGYKENFKNTFCHQKGHNNVKKRERKMWKYWQKDESIYYHYGGRGHLSCTYCTPKHLTNNEKNIET